jgi:hypothetical protein
MIADLADPRLRRAALAAGGVAALIAVLAWRLDTARFFQSWLLAWLFILGIALGALVNVTIHELTGGAWGFAVRRPLEAAIGTVPVVAALGLPLAFGLAELFPWARPEATEAVIAAKRWYLNPTAFDLRALVYFALWIALSVALRRFWRRGETNAGAAPQPVLRALSIIGLLVYALTMTLAAVDWIMSLSAEWYSTTFGLLIMVGQALSAFAFAVACSVLGGSLRGNAPEGARTAQDLGNILLTFVMLWAYLAFTQFLIIWAADLPAEIGWYVARSQPGWRWLAIAVLVSQFALPLIAMLFRSFKRDPRRLAWLCALVLIAHWGELLWLIEPPFRSDEMPVHWMDAVALLAVGGLWLARFLFLYAAPPAILAPAATRLADHG